MTAESVDSCRKGTDIAGNCKKGIAFSRLHPVNDRSFRTMKEKNDSGELGNRLGMGRDSAHNVSHWTRTRV